MAWKEGSTGGAGGPGGPPALFANREAKDRDGSGRGRLEVAEGLVIDQREIDELDPAHGVLARRAQVDVADHALLEHVGADARAVGHPHVAQVAEHPEARAD